MNDTLTVKGLTVNETVQDCGNKMAIVISNGTTVYNNSNSLGYCFIQFSSDTVTLVPWTDFIVNVTYTNGTPVWYSKTRLTPRMISDWANNVINGTILNIAAADLNKSGLTGGEVAAIVVGACVGAFFFALVCGMFIKWCTYGFMNPALGTKMMM
jgi:hypothetical protein